MQAIRDITRKVWPDAKAFAEDIDEPYERVRKWLQRGRIPDYAWESVIRRSKGKLSFQDLARAQKPRKERTDR